MTQKEALLGKEMGEILVEMGKTTPEELESILLGATERGLGGCMIATVKRQELSRALDIDSGYEILLVIALGKPGETVVIEEVGPDGDTKYWRDSQDVHHVPKRALDDIIIG